jgi:hypothetical protein
MTAARISRRSFFSYGVLMVTGAVGCTDLDIHTAAVWDPDALEVRNRDFSARAPFSMQFDGAALTTLSLTAVAGTVDIVDGEGTEVSIEGVRRVRSDSQLDADRSLETLDVDVSQSDATLHVATRQPRETAGRGYEVDYRIVVPSGFDLFVELVAGKIRASVVMGENGVVDFVNVAGDIELEIPTSTSASLRADVVAGTIHVSNLALDDQDPRAGVVRGALGSGGGSIMLSTVAGNVTLKGR